MSDLLNSLKELHGMDVHGTKWEYNKEEVAHDTVELIGDKLHTIGYIAPWGGEWIATIMSEANDDTTEYIARLHNIFPEVVNRLENIESTLKTLMDKKPVKSEMYVAILELLK